MNKDFLKYLGNKLKIGNLRSIHLNALPGQLATRLDLTDLDALPALGKSTTLFENDVKFLSEEFLYENLLSKPKFQFKVSLEDLALSNADEESISRYSKLIRRLNSIHSENEDNFLEHGIRTFGLGFPLLVKRSTQNPQKVIKAPLMIWNLDIERSHIQRNQWIIRREEDSPVYVNQLLISYLHSDDGVIIENIPDSFLEDGIVDNEGLVEIARSIIGRLDSEVDDLRLRIQKCLTKDEIERLTQHKPWILWSGIFGLYRAQKQSIIQDTEKILEEFDDFDFSDLKIESFLNSSNACVKTDPSQVQILSSLDSSEYKLIQGPPGTGKSQSLTAIISNVLEHGGKVLVVCEKKTALDVIFSNLKEAGLDKLAVLIEDVNRDRKSVIDKVRQVAQDVRFIYGGFNEQDYDAKLAAYCKYTKDYDARNSNLNGVIFRGMTFRGLIAEYLRLRRIVDIENNVFADIDFDLKESEYEELIAAISEARRIFVEVERNAFIFDKLDSKLFSDNHSTVMERDVFTRLADEATFLTNFDFSVLNIRGSNLEIKNLPNNLLKDFDFKEFESFRKDIRSNFEFWTTLANELPIAREFIIKNSLLPLNNLYNNVSSLNGASGHISTLQRYFESVNSSLEAISQTITLLPRPKRNGDFRYHWSDGLLRYFGVSNRSIYAFWKTLQEQHKSVEELMNSAVFSATMQIKVLIESLKPNIFDQQSTTLTVNACIEKRADFREYFRWRTLVESCAPLAKKCLGVLSATTEPAKWLPTLQFYYFSQLAEKFESEIEHFNESDSQLSRISDIESEVRSLQRHKILKSWDEKQFHSISAYNRRANLKWLFNHRRNTQYSRKNSLRSIVHQEIDLFTDIFPVMFLRPEVASSILPLKQNYFDVVLLDEASQLRLEDTYTSLFRAKIKVISGDRHQMPPSSFFARDISLDPPDENEDVFEDEEAPPTSNDTTDPIFYAESESLLDFGDRLRPIICSKSSLDFHYRSRHPFLIDFSNAAFYGSRLLPMPEKAKYKPIQLIHVNGLYDKNNTNVSEAEGIVQFIKSSYPEGPTDKLPSLGIATLNMHQRELIKSLINQRRIDDPSFAHLLDRIDESEKHFVKNLENIQGDERDIILISTTFGLNAEGKFRQKFGVLNTRRGYRLLNVIITRAKQQVFVFTSIPEEIYTKSYRDEITTKGNQGKAVLYAYLDYCDAITNDDDEKRLEILNLLAPVPHRHLRYAPKILIGSGSKLEFGIPTRLMRGS